MSETIRRLVDEVDPGRMRDDLFHLASDPLPCRKLNYALPGHDRSTLDEADEYIEAQLRATGYEVQREPVQVQAFRCDPAKPKQHQYSPPDPSDPWYTAHNLYAERPGGARPDETVVIVSHKDSPSWVDSPGAYDNAVGVIANLAIARAVAQVDLGGTLRFLFCNEEHTPWTSGIAARRAQERGDRIVAVINVDGIGGKAQAEIDAGRKTNVAAHTVPEGRPLAERFAEVNEAYGLGLVQRVEQRSGIGDDDGQFIQAGYPAAVLVIGSLPYGDPEYHAEGDVAERVDLGNVCLATKAVLAVVLTECRVMDGRE